MTQKDFFIEVSKKVGAVAEGKGYNAALGELAGEDHHIGEILYKAVRYRAKRDPDDLIKIAAWAYLIWSKNASTGE